MDNDEVAPTLKFLIVDDDDDIRDVLSQLVHSLDHNATAATDGLEAVGALQEERFDVMLLDLAMPRMSGLGVARWLHDNPDVAPDMWTIVLSAYADQSRAPLQELGVHTVVDKPMHLQQLRDLIAAGDPARH
jgi:CheY-like chemotaxis protein